MEGIQNIAEGAQVAGSVAAESGMSFEQFAASIAKVSEVTRQDGSIGAVVHGDMYLRTHLIAGTPLEPYTTIIRKLDYEGLTT